MSAARSARPATARIAVKAAALMIIPIAITATSVGAVPAKASRGHATSLTAGNLVVATSTFQYVPGVVAGRTLLPAGCVQGSSTNPCATAVTGGGYPGIFNNSSVDGSFGVTSKIVLQELKPNGKLIGSLQVPNSTMPGFGGTDDQMTTSFSSKSELALNLSPNGRTLTFMGYDAPVGVLDVSNSNTPGANPAGTNPALSPHYRAVAQLGTNGKFAFTLTNAFSGDNARAAILNPAANKLYMAGNANTGAGNAFITGTGAQITTPAAAPESAQTPGAPTPVGSFGVPQLGLSEGGDVAKENNYNALIVQNNVLYFVKGSGGKGVNTVYFVDTTGKACPKGTGVPQPGAQLPTTPLPGAHVDANGRLAPFNMCVLAGFPQILNSTNPISANPAGIFFADPHTLYIADEGNQTSPTTTGSYAAARPVNNPTAGLQKWVYVPAAKAWHLAYTVQTGLDLGQPYRVKGYPTENNDLPGGTHAPWAPATDGLRHLTGRVNPNGTVTLYATTSTVSGSGDQGADPNRLVTLTDPISALTPANRETFKTLTTASNGQLFRGVSFTPGTR